MKMSKTESAAKVRITDQFRSGQSMVYDLKCESIRLSIFMTFSAENSVWTIRAEAKQVPEPGQEQATGSSRDEALTVLAKAWQDHHGTIGYPAVDWVAIREALVAVRAV
jgi:hypothetical protein